MRNCHEIPDILSDVDVVAKCGDERHAECESLEQASVSDKKVVSGSDAVVSCPCGGGNDEGHGSGDSDYVPSGGDADIPVDVGSSSASVPGQMLPQGASDAVSSEKQLRTLLAEHALGCDIHMSALVGRVLPGLPQEELESVALVLFNSLVDEGVLERLSHDIYRRVPPVPKHGDLHRRGNLLGSMRQQGKKGAYAEKVQGAYVKDKSKLREGVGDKEDLEAKFSKFFQDLVATWNPCYSKDGVPRFD